MKSMRILRAISQRKIVWALAISVALLIAGVPRVYQAQGVPVTDEREPNNDFATAQRVRRFPTLIRGTSNPFDAELGLSFGGGIFEFLPDFYQVTTRGGSPGDTLVVSLLWPSGYSFPSRGIELSVFDNVLGGGFGSGFRTPSPILGAGFNVCDDIVVLWDFFFGFAFPICNSDLDILLFQSVGGGLVLVDFQGTLLGDPLIGESQMTTESTTVPVPQNLTNFFVVIGDFGPAAVGFTNLFFGTRFAIDNAQNIPYSLKLGIRGLGGGGGEDISPPTGKVRRTDVARLVRVDRTLTVSHVELHDVYHLTLDEPESVTLNLTSSAGEAGSIYLISGSDSELIASSRLVRPEMSRTDALTLDAGDYLIGVNNPGGSNAVSVLTVSRAEDNEILAAKIEMGLNFFFSRLGVTHSDLEQARQRVQEYLSQQ